MFRTTISFIISSSRIYCILQLCTNRANVSTCLVLRLELVLSNSLIIIIIISNTVLPGGTKLAATFMSRFVTPMTTWRIPPQTVPRLTGDPCSTVSAEALRSQLTARQLRSASRTAQVMFAALWHDRAQMSSRHFSRPPLSPVASLAACGAGSWFIIT